MEGGVGCWGKIMKQDEENKEKIASKWSKLRIFSVYNLYLVDHDRAGGCLGLEEVLLVAEEAHELAAEHRVVVLPGADGGPLPARLQLLLPVQVAVHLDGDRCMFNCLSLSKYFSSRIGLFHFPPTCKSCFLTQWS